MSNKPGITAHGTLVRINGFEIDDPVLAELVDGAPAERRADIIAQALAVGARGLTSMGAGVTVSEVEDRVRLVLESVATEAEARVDRLLTAGREAFEQSFDPDVRSSIVGRSLAEFAAWREGLLGTMDPDLAGSHTSRMLAKLTELLGPDGVLDAQLRSALDLEADGSALSTVHRTIEERFQELRELVIEERARHRGRAEEAVRGTAKGGDFEDTVETGLRDLAQGLGGCIVERTGATSGELGPEAYVGDFVLTLATGHRIVIEAKNQKRIDLTGKTGILEELDKAMANRNAGYSVCVSACDSFPREAGTFAVYGRRILVVDEGADGLLAVALRWAQAALANANDGTAEGLDASLVIDRLDRIRELSRQFVSSRKSLTTARSGLDAVHDSLGAMRAALLEIVDEIAREVGRVRQEGDPGGSLRVA